MVVNNLCTTYWGNFFEEHSDEQYTAQYYLVQRTRRNFLVDTRERNQDLDKIFTSNTGGKPLSCSYCAGLPT